MMAFDEEQACCPFCGSDDISAGEVLTSNDCGGHSTQSECQSCGALGPRAFLSEGEADYGDVKAIAAWNRRSAPTPNCEPEWIVNDMGELGVRVNGIHYFCYKGDNIVYETGLHDDGTPILHRNVGKREFGETVWPAKWYEQGRRETRYTQELVYTPGLSFGPPDNPKYKWSPLPPPPNT